MNTNYITDRVKIDDDTDCWLWQLGHTKDGYGVASRHQRSIRAHRLAWELFEGPIPDGAMVLHKCDVRHCVNPDHLFIGDAEANAKDMVKKGRSAKGEKHSQAALTDDQVKTIVADDRSHRDIAKAYGVDCATVTRIKRGKAWSHIPDVASQPDTEYVRPEKRTHCPKGHKYDEKNTYTHKGKRYCRTCMNARRRRLHQKKRNPEVFK